MRRTTLTLMLLVALAACNRSAAYRNYSDQKLGVDVVAAAAAPEAAPDAAGAAAAAADPAKPAVQAAGPMLAYDYSATLSVPDGKVRGLMARHQQACAAAGTGLCQVLESRLSTDHGVTDGMLKLRAEPRWLAGFRGGLEGDAKAAGGSLTRAGVESEDLTREIVDTEASLRAKTTLRDRLEKLLAEHPGKMSDLLEIEKQLADTQGEIDAAQSELAVMRDRVRMSTMTLSYGSHAEAIGRGVPRPFAEALANFGLVVAFAASAIVYFVAFALPFLIIGVPLVWWLLRRRRARKQARENAAALEAAKDA